MSRSRANDMFTVILGFTLRSIKTFFARERFTKVFTVSGFIVVSAFLVALVYALFYYGFRYVSRDAYFGDALSFYMVELFYLVTFILVLGSALLSGLFALFRGRGEEFILATPAYSAKFTLATLRIMFSSLWPLLVIVIPALVALHKVIGLSFLGVVLALLSSVFLFMLSSLLSIVVLLFAGALLLHLRAFSFRNIVLAASALFALFLAFIWQRFASVDLIGSFHAGALDMTIADITPIAGQFEVFPSHLSALAVYFGSHDDLLSALEMTFYAFCSLVSVAMVLYLLKPHYLTLWQRSREGSTEKGKERLLSGMITRAKSPIGAVFGKEMIAFLRNGRGIFWLAFILLIWGIQAATNHVFVRGLAGEKISEAELPSVVGMFQFAVAIYFSAMFVLRFAFPSWSVERRTDWLIGASALDKKKVFRTKFVFFASLFALLGAIFTTMNAVVADAPRSFGILLVLLVVIGTVTLTALGLSLGALFPNRDTDDPERLSTTLPGLGFILLALLYGALGAFALRVGSGASIAFACASVLGAWWILQTAERGLRTRE